MVNGAILFVLFYFFRLKNNDKGVIVSLRKKNESTPRTKIDSFYIDFFWSKSKLTE
jgi:hypothetical protein